MQALDPSTAADQEFRPPPEASLLHHELLRKAERLLEGHPALIRFQKRGRRLKFAPDRPALALLPRIIRMSIPFAFKFKLLSDEWRHLM